MRCLLVLALFAAGCDTDVSANDLRDGAMPDAAMPHDLSAVADLAVVEDLFGVDFTPPPTGADYAGCAGMFVDATKGPGPTISFADFAYTPNCVEVTSKQMVTWSGDFTAHPLTFAPGNPMMVTPTAPTMTTRQVVFATPGYYGFHCLFHGLPDGTGMAGNVHVVP